MNILRAAVLYFTLVFGTGFILGVIRVLWVVPYLGTRWAELLEMPIMLVVEASRMGTVGRLRFFKRSRASLMGQFLHQLLKRISLRLVSLVERAVMK
ncbi:MAG: hypothetical protein Kow00121_34360 [Elainellaceae cyanobacterium]